MKSKIGAFLEGLRVNALHLGASDAKIISADMIPIEDEIIEMCKEPLCPGYGKSANCPPHAMKPPEARELVKDFQEAVLFKIDVPPAILLSGGIERS